MIAVVLVGGTGTRLRPLTLDRAKPMLPILGRPFLAHLLGALEAAGVERVIFSCGYLPDAIRAAFGSGDPQGLRLEYVVEDEPLGTAGAIRHAALGRVDEPFLALNGDVLSQIDLAALAAWHRERDARATIALTPVDEPSRYGLVETEADGAVRAFVEKPGGDYLARTPAPYHVNAGAYVLDPTVLEAIPAGRAVSIEREVFPLLVGHGLYARPLAGYWNDIGTPESYLAANRHLLAQAPPAGAALLVAEGAAVDPRAELWAPVHVGADCVVAAGARVEASVLGDAVILDARAEVVASVVHEDASIGADARVTGSIIGARARVGPGATVEGLAVVGPGVEVPAGAHVVAERLAPQSAGVPS